MIPFNKPHLTGKEASYINDVVNSGQLSGNGKYTQLCHEFMEQRYGFGKCLLTTSCTAALEMAAILLNIKKGDEVIMPSYTFVSTANAFVLRGAKIVFVDSDIDHPGIDEKKIESLITPNTKAIVPVHYAGVACNMDIIMDVAKRYNLWVVEDAAQAVDSYYTGKDGVKRALGTIGHLAAFSFHETKNITSGEGGMLAINHKPFEDRAEIIWEKGTNRSAFLKGEVDEYEWVDIGSSFLPSEMIAAFLYAQLECIESIQGTRKSIWETYYLELKDWATQNGIKLPFVPGFATNNAHTFYLVVESKKQRKKFISQLKSKGILTVFHYVSLHKSKFYTSSHGNRKLALSEKYTDNLVRLPLFHDLKSEEITQVIKAVKQVDLS